MISASYPADEEERLRALRGFEVLDTAPEQAFDDLTQLASEICGTPIALVSLVDAERQWFKSRVGLDAPETSRDLAFCAHAILGDGVFEVPDASKDERFADNPLVLQAPDIRFYAGAPLRTAAGRALGTLCVIDRQPRSLTGLQRRTLEVLGRQVMSQMELRLAARKALDLNQAKSRFLASMSHELRTHMNAILGFSALIKKKGTDSRTRDFAGRIHASGRRLLEMINDLLDISKIEAGKIDFKAQPVDLAAMALDLVSELEAVAKPGVALRHDVPPDLEPVQSDPARLRQVLVNILGNALKFTEQGEVVLQVEADKNGAPACLRVSDTGIGMTDDQLENIFKPFEQVHHGTDRPFEGAGLGLALCQTLCRGLGLRLGVTSEPGRGSVFSVYFPDPTTLPRVAV